MKFDVKKFFEKIKTPKGIKKTVICLNAVVLLVALIVYVYRVTHLYEIHLDASQISASATGTVYDSFDESFSNGIYDITPEWTVKKGYYVFSVSYEGTSEKSFVWPLSYTSYINGITQNPIFLDGKSGVENGFWINHKLPIALRICYSGEGNVKITGFSMKGTVLYPNKAFFTTVFALLFLDFLIYLTLFIRTKKVDKTLIFCAFALVGLTFMTSLPAIGDKVLAICDTDFHAARIESLKDGLLDGQFPVRISPDFYEGYGYANSIFYGELFLYIPAVLRILGFSLTEAFNFYIFAVNALTLFACFAVFRKIFKNDLIALSGSILYGFAPYRLSNLYLRGALGEYTALAFLPFVFYGLYSIYVYERDSREFKRSYIYLIIGLTGIIQSHTLSVEMTGGFIILICLLLIPMTLKKSRFIMLLKSAGLTLLVNIWFVIPFLDYTKNLEIRFKSTSAQTMVQSTGNFLAQLFYMFPKYSLSAEKVGSGFIDDMPTGMGPALIFGMLLLAAVLVMIFAEKGAKEENGAKPVSKTTVGAGIVLLIVAFVASWMSTIYFPWDSLFEFKHIFAVLISSVQFVWRFLGIASFAAAACTVIALIVIKERRKEIAQILAAVLVTFSVIGGMYFIEIAMQNGVWHEYTDLQSLRFGTTTSAMGGEFVLSRAKHDVVTEIDDPRGYEGAEVLSWSKSGTHVDMEISADADGGYVLLPLLNYKGYTAKSDDGQITKANLGEGDAAEVRLNLPAGYTGKVHVKFLSPWYWRVAEIISLLSIAGIVVLEVRGKARERVEKL